MLGTKWKQCICEVHGVVESVIEEIDVNPGEAEQRLTSCDAAVTNLLSEVEWWRLFLLRDPMPSRMRVLLRKSVSLGCFGPRKQRVVDRKQDE